MVWPWSGLRAAEHASVRPPLLPASDGSPVNDMSSLFPRVISLKSSPYDVRLWQAQASCYEEIGR